MGKIGLGSLSPIGIGTPDCESLSSYVQRLSASNGTFPGQLVFRLLAWMDQGRDGNSGRWAGRPGRLRIGLNNNCFAHADVWLRTLQPLTARGDLVHLTTRTWDHLFPYRGFQHANLLWCQHCISEDRIPYHRLAWMLQSVRVCPKHAIRLQQHCTYCGRSVPVLHDRSQVLICPWCANDLRMAPPMATAVEVDSFDRWAAIEIGDVIARSAQPILQRPWNACDAFQQLCTRHRLNNAAQFARFLGTSKLTTWYWLRGKARPSLPLTLRVYHRFGVSLAAEITGRKPAATQHNEASKQNEIYLRRPRTVRNIDWVEIAKHLKAAATVPVEQADTLLKVSRALGIDRRTLRSHEPQLCRELSARFQQRRRLEINQRENRLGQEMLAAIQTLSNNALQPSQQNIERILQRPGLFNRRYARAILVSLLAPASSG